MKDILEKMREYSERSKALARLACDYADAVNRSGSVANPGLRRLLSDMLLAGYRPFPDSTERPEVRFLLQKRFDDAEGNRLYFITAEFWDLSVTFPDHRNPTMSLDAQFYLGARRGDDSRTINLKLFDQETMSLTEAEAIFAKFYREFGCVPYESKDEF